MIATKFLLCDWFSSQLITINKYRRVERTEDITSSRGRLMEGGPGGVKGRPYPNLRAVADSGIPGMRLKDLSPDGQLTSTLTTFYGSPFLSPTTGLQKLGGL